MEIHNIVWRGIEIEVTFTPERYGMVDHIELRTQGRTPLPVTETGYRSNFIRRYGRGAWRCGLVRNRLAGS